MNELVQDFRGRNKLFNFFSWYFLQLAFVNFIGSIAFYDMFASNITTSGEPTSRNHALDMFHGQEGFR